MRVHTSARRRTLKAITTVFAAVALFLTSALPAWAADSITLTFVRHGESYGNIAGAGIDTSVPGPDLTALGEQQAEAIAEQLEDGGYDSIWTSNMVRTQETAAPLEALLPNLPVYNGNAGIREIGAGIFEGSPIDSGIARIFYFLIPVAWTLGLRYLVIPGAENGNQFEARFNSVISDIESDGYTDPLIFSHGAAIMVWTMMNVNNPDISLMLTHTLGNTAVVVVTGNQTDGWTLVSWDGIAVSQTPSFGTKMFVNLRDLVVAPQTAVYNVVQAVKSRDLSQVVAAVRDGVVMVAKAGVTFVKNTVTDVVQAIRGVLPGGASATAASAAAKAKASTAATTDATEETSNGATDLSDGNKVEPAKSSVGSSRSGSSAQATSDDTSSSASTDKADGGAKKGTGSSKRAHKAAA